MLVMITHRHCKKLNYLLNHQKRKIRGIIFGLFYGMENRYSMYDVYEYGIYGKISHNTLLPWNAEFIFFTFPIHFYFSKESYFSNGR